MLIIDDGLGFSELHSGLAPCVLLTFNLSENQKVCSMIITRYHFNVISQRNRAWEDGGWGGGRGNI